MRRLGLSRRKFLAWSGSTVLTAGLPAGAAAAAGKRFVTANNSPYDTLDPHMVFDIGRIASRLNLYDCLVRWGGNPPRLAMWLATIRRNSTTWCRCGAAPISPTRTTGPAICTTAAISAPAMHHNARFGALTDRALEPTSQEQRRPVYEEASRISVEDAAGLLIYNTKWYGPFTKNVRFCPIGDTQDIRWMSMT